MSVTTYTTTSVNLPSGTWSLTSKVVESVDSALDHVREIGKGLPVEPFYVCSAEGWRWTWEYFNGAGVRCTDTVRIV